MTRVAITVPCFNEEQRFRRAEIERLFADRRVELVLVDDGSSDGTARVLGEVRSGNPGRAEVVSLARNSGKSEAVRTGMRAALARGADVVGFADADLATPVDELLRLVDVMCDGGAAAVIACRQAGRGSDIARPLVRRALGRVFSAAGSAALGRWVRDTQCGAKLFRHSAALDTALAEPFRSRWAFDVELLGRWIIAGGADEGAGLVEVPLRRWSEVPGSKLRAASMARAGLDLLAVAVDLRRLRRQTK